MYVCGARTIDFVEEERKFKFKFDKCKGASPSLQDSRTWAQGVPKDDDGVLDYALRTLIEDVVSCVLAMSVCMSVRSSA